MNSSQILSVFSGIFREIYTTRYHNLHTFLQVVSESVRWCSIKMVFLFIKFTGTLGIELVSPNKNHKIPENVSYFRGVFKTQSNIYDGAICENS